MSPSPIRGVVIWLLCALFLFAPTIGVSLASAEVLISVDKSTQQMSVSVDGVPRYRFSVSTGRAGYGTPNGTYHPERLAASWFSKLYYNSPMPHSIFFHGGYAIHGSHEINRLGGPASHGCVRLHPANAATVFDLVKSEGMAATTIVVSGSNPVVARRTASSRPPHRREETSSHARRYQPDHEWERRAYDDRYYEGKRPAYDDRYRPDYGQPYNYLRPEPRFVPFFNSY
jgi:hypothetical protein